MQTLFHRFLKAAGIPFTEVYADEVYLTEPNSNSLLGMKRMLGHYGLQMKGIKAGPEDLKALPFPSILHVTEDFLLISKPSELTDEVLKAWDGIVLYIADRSKAQEPEYQKHRREHLLQTGMYGFLLILPLLTILFRTEVPFTLFEILFFLLGLMGLTVSVLLLKKQLGETSRWANRICDAFQRQGCDAVLESRQSKVFGILSWSEVGCGYFWTQTLLLGLSSSAGTFLSAIALLGLLFPLWSLYTQARMHRWCGLCLLTLAVLILQGILVLCFLSSFDIFLFLMVPIQLILIGIMLLAGILVAHLLAEGIRWKKEAFRAACELRFTLRTPTVFQALMSRATLHPYELTDVTQTLGNPEAPHRVAIFESAHCPHCQELKPEIDAFLKEQGSHFALDVINVDSLSAEEQEAFRRRTGLTSTPTILLDGCQLPAQCKLSDLVG